MSNKKSFPTKSLLALLFGVVLFSVVIYLFNSNYITINISKRLDDDKPIVLVTEDSLQNKSINTTNNIIPQANPNINIQSDDKQSEKTPIFEKQLSVSTGFADLVEHVSPSIVNITALKSVQDPDAAMNELNPALRDLLKQFIPQGTPIAPPKIPSGGSGFVIRADGFIVTNNHVIEDTQNIQVTFSNGEKYEATIYAQDPLTDLAVLKINAKNLQPLKLSNYDNLRVGDWVIAVGNPFGLESTVSAGIISAKGRQLNLSSPLTDYIQTDVAINKGNSGGPMINTSGEVVGINTAIYSPTGGSIGIGFAIPSKTISKVVTQLINNKKVLRSWLGVTYQPIEDKSLAQVFKLDKPMGGVVLNIAPKSPAEVAKIQVGDIIYAVNGNIIEDFKTLPQIISEIQPNTLIKLGIIRSGKKIVLDVILKEAPVNNVLKNNNKATSPKDLEKSQIETFPKIGFKVAQIDTNVRNYFSMKENVAGVAVVAVKAGSIAEQKNILSGYKIISVNNNLVYNLKDLSTYISKYSESGLLFLMENLAGNRQFYSITKEELKAGLAY